MFLELGETLSGDTPGLRQVRAAAACAHPGNALTIRLVKNRGGRPVGSRLADDPNHAKTVVQVFEDCMGITNTTHAKAKLGAKVDRKVCKNTGRTWGGKGVTLSIWAKLKALDHYYSLPPGSDRVKLDMICVYTQSCARRA